MSAPLVPLERILTSRLSPVTVSALSTYPTIGILNSGRGVFQQPELQGSKTSYKKLFQVHDGQVLYSKLKAFEGSIAIVPKKFDGYFVSSEFPAFDVHGVWPSFLKHILQSEQFTLQMRQASHGLGARRERMHPRDFLQIKIPLPPLAEQRAIAARLDARADFAVHSMTVASSTEASSMSIRHGLFEQTYDTIRVGKLITQTTRFEAASP